MMSHSSGEHSTKAGHHQRKRGKRTRGRIFIAGDFCPSDRLLSLLLATPPQQALGDLAEYVGRADLALVNLECPLVTTGTRIAKTGPHLRGRPEIAALLRKLGFDVAGLANNHIRDFGGDGVITTLEECTRSGLRTVGAGRTIAEAAEPLVIDLDGFRIGLIAACEDEFSVANGQLPGGNRIDPLRLTDQIFGNRGRWDVLVVLLHAGREHYPYPTPRQRALCRWLVGLGASAVICQHSHCPGCYEQVGGSLIVYGQGNFLFDPQGTVPPTWFEGFAVSMDLAPGRIEGFELLPFRRLLPRNQDAISSFARSDAVLEEVIRRSGEIQKAGFVEQLWQNHCNAASSTYKLWLTGARWHDRLHFRLARLLRRRFMPFSKEAQRRYSLLLRCDTHREMLETILADTSDDVIEALRK